MLLFVVLGNPGPEHRYNRHNVGFMVIDAIAKRRGFPPWRRGGVSQVSDYVINDQRVMLMRPDTYMNESGRAVAEAARYLNIALDSIVVFHDELQLAPAAVRVREVTLALAAALVCREPMAA